MSRDFASLKLDDSDPEEAAASHPDGRSHGTQQTPSRGTTKRQGNDPARDEALRKELEKVRGVNEVVQRVISSLEKSKENMDTVNVSVRSASTLLDTWTRILSQTEHNQRLLLDPEWRGATQDLEDLENESVLKQQAAERKAAEEEMRREAAARAAEEEERKRAASSGSSRGTRGRARASSLTARGTSSRGAATTTSTSTRRVPSTTTSRAGSGIGRGIGSGRGRARGA